MARLSVIIATLNEEEDIRGCLESVKWADEIIIVDMFSTDKTLDICGEYATKILQNNTDRCLNINKNIGIKHASSDWILELDADERVTPELRVELNTAMRQEEYYGYMIQFSTYWFGKEIKYGGWQDWHLRFYRKDVAGYDCRIVHEEMNITGKVGRLRNKIVHYAHKDIFEQLNKTNLYTTQEAAALYRMGKRPDFLRLFTSPFKAFVYRYILLRGFMDGMHGFIIAVLLTAYSFLTQIKLWELSRREKL